MKNRWRQAAVIQPRAFVRVALCVCACAVLAQRVRGQCGDFYVESAQPLDYVSPAVRYYTLPGRIKARDCAPNCAFKYALRPRK